MTAEALEQSVLESKDKEQLSAIAQALGIKTSARLKKADIIQKILETTGALPAEAPAAEPAPAAAETPAESTPEQLPLEAAPAPAPARAGRNGKAQDAPTPDVPEIVLGPDGEPLAEWEIELMKAGDAPADTPADASAAASTAAQTGDDGDDGDGDGADGGQRFDGDGESRSSRRRRRRRGKGPREDGPQGEDGGRQDGGRQDGGRQGGQQGQQHDQPGQEPVPVAGYLDLRDEGYGFLRVNGYLASKEDVYIPGSRPVSTGCARATT